MILELFYGESQEIYISKLNHDSGSVMGRLCVILQNRCYLNGHFGFFSNVRCLSIKDGNGCSSIMNESQSLSDLCVI